MAKYQDIQLINNDLNIDNNIGDFLEICSLEQESSLIIELAPGNLYQFPSCGCAIIDYLSSNANPLTIENLIKTQLTQDGFQVESVNLNGSTLNNLNIQVIATKP
jgi:hypothetical protein